MITLPNEHFNAQISEKAPGEWYLTLTIEIFNSYWTSMPCKLVSNDQSSAKLEAQLIMIKLWNLLDLPLPPSADGTCTRCGVFWGAHDETDHVFKDVNMQLRHKPKPSGNDSVTSP